MTSVVFVHGIRSGQDAGKAAGTALDLALARRGTGHLADRGVDFVAVDWRARLDGDEPDNDPGPPAFTDRKLDADDRQRAIANRSIAQADLERHLKRRESHRAGPLALAGNRPLDLAASPVAARVVPEVDRYCRSEARRNACLRTALAQLPEQGDVVLIGHSLGSVLVADLLFHLPPDVRVKLLVTIGSPLARETVRGHLRRMRDRFPIERVGPWLNVIGQWDPVSAGRGIATWFPEALDAFADTGAVKEAHHARTYLDQDVVADAVDFALRRPRRAAGPPLPDVRVPDDVLPLLAAAQYALRLEQAMEGGSSRTRFGQARAALARDLAAGVEPGTPGHHPVLERLTHDHSHVLRGRFPPGLANEVLLQLGMSNAIAPYEVKYDDDVERVALKALANDLGFPEARAEAVLAAEGKARSSQGSGKDWQKKALLAAGAAVLVAAPFMVAVAAPAGLAGGASIMAGLAALGPGGMMGGLGMVGLVGGAGGAAIAGALTTGTSAAVVERVVFLEALARADHALQDGAGPYEVWRTLVEMETSLNAEWAKLAAYSDPKARILKELSEKRTSVRKALEALTRDGLAPAGLAGGGRPELSESGEERRRRLFRRDDD